MSARLILKEADIAKTCTDLLSADGWRAVRTDPVADRRRGKGFGELGMADYLYIRYEPGAGTSEADLAVPDILSVGAEVMWVEWKRIDRRGKTTAVRPHQLDWHRAERARGAYTLIAGVDFPATIDGFIAWYRTSGLARK